jgi:hypothetical protein
MSNLITKTSTERVNNAKGLIEGQIVETSELSTQEFSERICLHINAAVSSWLEVAHLLAEAEDELSKKRFGQLKEMIPLSNSSICKLIKIAEFSWIDEHKEQLQRIESWATLHEISKLKTSELVKFEKAHIQGANPAHFTRKDVSQFRVIESKAPYTLASIKLDRKSHGLKKAEAKDFYNCISTLSGLSGVTADLTESGEQIADLSQCFPPGTSATKPAKEGHSFGNE